MLSVTNHKSHKGIHTTRRFSSLILLNWRRRLRQVTLFEWSPCIPVLVLWYPKWNSNPWNYASAGVGFRPLVQSPSNTSLCMSFPFVRLRIRWRVSRSCHSRDTWASGFRWPTREPNPSNIKWTSLLSFLPILSFIFPLFLFVSNPTHDKSKLASSAMLR